MLIKCPECELQVSDKALSCPHCGYPFKDKPKQRKPSGKHMRLPNGFGQISLLKQNLRNPYRVMVTVGKTEEGKPICKLLKPQAYFKTYNEAYEALVEYHKNPYELTDEITVEMLYDEWSSRYYDSLTSDSSIRTLKAAWKYCWSIKNINVKDVKVKTIRDVVEESYIETDNGKIYATPNMKFRIKTLLNLMFDYAVEYEMVETNKARAYNLPKEIKKISKTTQNDHINFELWEMEKLWTNRSIEYVDAILIQCYTGLRPQELCNIEVKNIKDGFIKGGMKTVAGKDRMIPIHSVIEPIIKEKIKECEKIGSEYLLFNKNGDRVRYSIYRDNYKKVIKKLDLNLKHRPHDPRVFFISECKKYKVDEYAIKYIVGHSIADVTEKVYTKRELEWLKEEIEKIKK